MSLAYCLRFVLLRFLRVSVFVAAQAQILRHLRGFFVASILAQASIEAAFLVASILAQASIEAAFLLVFGFCFLFFYLVST